MRIQVVTTLNKKLYNSYAKRFFETYNWPFDLTVYSEDMLDIQNYDTIVRSIYDGGIIMFIFIYLKLVK